MDFRYRQENAFCQRKAEAEAIRKQHENRLPVIIEKYAKSKMEEMGRTKFMIPTDMTVGQLHILLRKHRMSSKVGFWFFVDNLIPTASTTIGQLYEEHHDEDGFLYILYSDENVFGAKV